MSTTTRRVVKGDSPAIPDAAQATPRQAKPEIRTCGHFGAAEIARETLTPPGGKPRPVVYRLCPKCAARRAVAVAVLVKSHFQTVADAGGAPVNRTPSMDELRVLLLAADATTKLGKAGWRQAQRAGVRCLTCLALDTEPNAQKKAPIPARQRRARTDAAGDFCSAAHRRKWKRLRPDTQREAKRRRARDPGSVQLAAAKAAERDAKTLR